ncbi:MAG: Gfo/Idh/MocA family oxidoreductase [Anaerolineae bacterium]|nr:Gfo/Idh/MocA family oxidoreductase [Anaerolineae bacterium]
MAQKVRWGILGAANINLDVVPAMQRSPRSEVVALASRTLSKAQAQAARLGIPQAVEGYEAVLADPAIDAVYIPLANHLHVEWTVRALEAGKHVLCEKPLALTVESAKQVVDTAARTGKIAAEAFAYLHQPQTRQVKELVEGGEIGEVRIVKGTFTFPFENMGDFRWNPDYGGGSLWDIGSYPVTYAYWLLGLPNEVYGRRHDAPSGVDMSFAGQMHFDRGAVAQFDCSFDQEFFLDMDIRGTQGRITVDLDGDPKAEQAIAVYHDGDIRRLSVPPENQYFCEVRDIENAILDGVRPLISLDDSLSFARILCALHQSAQTNAPVGIRG